MFEGDWYCIYTKPRMENLANQTAQDEGLKTFHPLIEKRRLIRGKAEWVKAPLFPNYVFIQAKDDEILKLKHLRGASRIVGFGKEGSSFKFPGEVLAAVNEFLDNGVFKDRNQDLKTGDKVKILDGPLKGVEAIFKESTKEGERAVILFEILSIQQEVKVKKEDIVKEDD